MFHLSKSNLMNQPGNYKFVLYIWSKVGVIFIPKYANPAGVHVNWIEALAQDLLKFILYPEKTPNLLMKSIRVEVDNSGLVKKIMTSSA